MRDATWEYKVLSMTSDILGGGEDTVEPLLDEKLHAKVTQLLCELTAYDIMQAVHTMQQARPKTAFRG